MDCIFCEIANKTRKADIVYEDETFVVFRDIRPKASLHLLLIPKEHIDQPPVQLAGKSRQVLGGLFELASKIAKEQGVFESGYRLVNNNGRWAGQEIDHFHLHFLSSPAT